MADVSEVEVARTEPCPCAGAPGGAGIQELCPGCTLRGLRALDPLPGRGLAIVDFDDTLLLRNSTSAYFESLRPRWAGAGIGRALRAVRPWRWYASGRAHPLYHEHWMRVVLSSALLPWSLPRWRRTAPVLGAQWRNEELLAALRSCGREIHAATFGFRPVVAPLLDGLAPDARLTVAAGFRTAPRLRAEGKLAALQRELGADAVADGVCVTDSLDDADLLGTTRHAFYVRWGPGIGAVQPPLPGTTR